MIKTIYKKDSKGKVRFLSVTTSDNKVITLSGLFKTKSPTINERTCSAKNIGKKNYISANDQAIIEADAIIKNKLKRNYFENYFEAEEDDTFSVMLAKSFNEDTFKFSYDLSIYPAYEKNINIPDNHLFLPDNTVGQPKLDGMRCYYRKGKLYSRENIEIKFMDHIIKDLIDFIDMDVYIDGELYIHGENFQDIMDKIKDFNPEENKKVQFHIYDAYFDENEVTKNYSVFRRITLIFRKIKDFNIAFKNSTSLRLVRSKYMDSLKNLKIFKKELLDEGYEGVMLKLPNAPYDVNKRSSNLLKVKDFIDEACEIISIGPAKNKPTWARPVVLFNGKSCPCNLKMSVPQKEEMLKNKEKYIGRIAELRYFEKTKSGMPRFPVIVGIREDKFKSDKK